MNLLNVCNVDSLRPIDDTPILVEGGMIDDTPIYVMGESGREGALTCTMKEKTRRKIYWALGLTNNWRKRHGLPMYRKLER